MLRVAVVKANVQYRNFRLLPGYELDKHYMRFCHADLHVEVDGRRVSSYFPQPTLGITHPTVVVWFYHCHRQN